MAPPSPASAPSTPNPRRLIVIRLAVLVLVILLGYGIYGLVQSLNPVITAYGNVDIRDVNLSFRVSGRVAHVLKDEGDAVKAGELVAQLDREPLQHAFEQAEADVKAKRAALNDAHQFYERNKKLVDNGAVSSETFQDTAFTRDQAESNLKLSEAKLASAQTDLNDTELAAPSDGVIITRALEPGSMVQPGATVLTLLLEKPVWVRAYLDERDLGQVHPGKEVEVSVDSDPGKVFHGVVGFISPQAEFTPKAVETTQLRTSLVYRIRIVVNDADPSLRQGMPVTVRIHKN